jgi:hypothetical protein
VNEETKLQMQEALKVLQTAPNFARNGYYNGAARDAYI